MMWGGEKEREAQAGDVTSFFFSVLQTGLLLSRWRGQPDDSVSERHLLCAWIG